MDAEFAFMDDNARTHCEIIVYECLELEAKPTCGALSVAQRLCAENWLTRDAGFNSRSHLTI